MDAEISRRSKRNDARNTTRVIVTLVPGAKLPLEFKRFVRRATPS